MGESRGRAKRGEIKSNPTSSKTAVLFDFFVEFSEAVAIEIMEERNHTPQFSTGDQYP